MNQAAVTLGVVLLLAGFGTGAGGLFAATSAQCVSQHIYDTPPCSFAWVVTLIGVLTFIGGFIVVIWGAAQPSRLPMPPYPPWNFPPLPPPPQG